MNRFVHFLGRYGVAALAHLYLTVFGWLPRYRAACYEAAYQLGWRRRPTREPSGPPTLIPPITQKELIPDPPFVRVLESDVASGNVSEYEILVIAQFMAARKPAACFEIGTFDGRTALNMAANAGPQCRVYTLDLPADQLERTVHDIAHGDAKYIRKKSSGARFVGTPWEEQITQLYGDSATFDFSPYEGKMDVVFVDGSHSYEYVRADTATALKLIKPEGGLILWHDYGSKWWKDLTRAMNELYENESRLRTMRHIRGTTLVVWEERDEGGGRKP